MTIRNKKDECFLPTKSYFSKSDHWYLYIKAIHFWYLVCAVQYAGVCSISHILICGETHLLSYWSMVKKNCTLKLISDETQLYPLIDHWWKTSSIIVIYVATVHSNGSMLNTNMHSNWSEMKHIFAHIDL
jgi:hypothetical protein